MIRYALICAEDHGFESWFRDSAAYEALERDGAIDCPICGNPQVRKALMAPSVVTSKRKAVPVPQGEAAPLAIPPSEPASQPAVLLDERQKRLREMLKSLRQEIVATADDVGRAFAAEARRIHDGEAEPRSIYGEASRDEVEALLEDGIPLMPMPALPDDHN